MILANAEPSATRRPTMMRLIGSVAPIRRALFEAMKRFEGPAKGIRLNPKEKSRTVNSSTKDANLIPSGFVS